VYNWFDHLKGKGHFISGYVIMPNHIHALIAFRNTGQAINTIVGNGKRFIAYEIVKRLKEQQEDKLLHRLHLSVEAKDKERNKQHEIWEDSFDWKECRTNEYRDRNWTTCMITPAKANGTLQLRQWLTNIAQQNIILLVNKVFTKCLIIAVLLISI